jgi:hypothetical protein
VHKFSRAIRAAFIGIGALVALGASPLITSADTGVAHSGVYGIHYLADSAEYPDVTCVYNTSNVISAVVVRDPFVFARNRTTSVDSQLVGWFFQVQKSSSSGWVVVANSALQRRTATDQQVADFSPMTKSFAGDASRQYRIVISMRWYNAARTAVEGRAIHRVDWYSWVLAPSFRGSCPGGIL